MKRFALCLMILGLGCLVLMGCPREYQQAVARQFALNAANRAAQNEVDTYYARREGARIEAERAKRRQEMQRRERPEKNRRRYYEGSVFNGAAHYKGWVENNALNGHGILIMPNGERYEGNFVNNKPNGKGELIFPGGSRKYEGVFADGRIQRGKMFLNGQLTYNGEFDVADTGLINIIRGKWYYSSGNVYEGEFVDGVPSGRGEKRLSSGSVFRGIWVRGKLEGHGEAVFNNGVFVGEFRDGKEVSGTFTSNDGTIISGLFHGSGESTKGIIRYPDGRTYEGEWEGRCSVLGCEARKGYWTLEKPHGDGKMIYPDGEIKSGRWKLGEFVSKN